MILIHPTYQSDLARTRIYPHGIWSSSDKSEQGGPHRFLWTKNKVLQPEPPDFGVFFSGVHVNLSGGIKEEALEVATIPMEIPGKSPRADTLNPPTADTATFPFLSLEANEVWPEESGEALPAIFEAKTPSIPQHPTSRLIKRPSRPYRHWNSQTADSRYHTLGTCCQSHPHTGRLCSSSQYRHPAHPVTRHTNRATKTTRRPITHRQQFPRKQTGAARENGVRGLPELQDWSSLLTSGLPFILAHHTMDGDSMTAKDSATPTACGVAQGAQAVNVRRDVREAW